MAKAKQQPPTPDEHSLNTTGKQGAAGAPPQDEPTAEQIASRERTGKPRNKIIVKVLKDRRA